MYFAASVANVLTANVSWLINYLFVVENWGKNLFFSEFPVESAPFLFCPVCLSDEHNRNACRSDTVRRESKSIYQVECSEFSHHLSDERSENALRWLTWQLWLLHRAFWDCIQGLGSHSCPEIWPQPSHPSVANSNFILLERLRKHSHDWSSIVRIQTPST